MNDHINDASSTVAGDAEAYSFDPSSLTGADDDIPLIDGDGGDAADDADTSKFRYHADEPLDLSFAFDGVTPTTIPGDDDGETTTTAPPPQVWLLKVPGELRDRWTRVEEPGKVLGKLRVYDL